MWAPVKRSLTSFQQKKSAPDNMLLSGAVCFPENQGLIFILLYYGVLFYCKQYTHFQFFFLKTGKSNYFLDIFS